MAIRGRKNTVRTKESLYRNWIDGKLEPDGSNLDEQVTVWEEKLQPNTVKSLLYLAKDFCGQDIKGHIKRVGRSQQQKAVRALSKPEIAALTPVVKAEYPKLFLPYMLALHTGMRRGEVWGLQYGDVDILNGTITVQRSYTGPTKSGKSRIIPISYALEKILLAETPIKSYNNCRERRKENVINHIFDPNPPLRAAAARAGLREANKLTFHALRHSFATLALESGISPRLVSKTLGHASTATTLSIYWAVTDEKIDLGFLPNE